MSLRHRGPGDPGPFYLHRDDHDALVLWRLESERAIRLGTPLPAAVRRTFGPPALLALLEIAPRGATSEEEVLAAVRGDPALCDAAVEACSWADYDDEDEDDGVPEV